ncbi:hypothetical protein Tco_0944789, partial [Tanacetum coccineum]
MFLKYSTGQIPPKKSRGKGSQGKKTADTPMADVDVSEESDSEPARKRTASRRVVKKKVTIFAADNIIHDPNVALELGKSISLTEDVEEEAARDTFIQDTPRVPDESTVIPSISSEGTEEDHGNDEEIDWIDSDEEEENKDDTDDDKSINLEMTDDEETDDEFVHGVEQVNDSEDEEITNAEFEESRN